MEHLVSCLGIVVFLALAWLLSANRKAIKARPILMGLMLQFGFALIILKTSMGQAFFLWAEKAANRLIAFAEVGEAFIFGAGFKDHYFAFAVLPTVIFISSCTAILFYLGIAQWMVRTAARIMVRLMDASGAESLVAAANIFMGQIEAPLLIRPYIERLTRAETLVMMLAGMSTIAGGLLVAYAQMGMSAGHLLVSSVISAPGAIMMARILLPETETPQTKGVADVAVEIKDVNILDAACRGAGDGVKVVVMVAACVLCFISFAAMANWVLAYLPMLSGQALSLERVFGWVFSPLAWLMGVGWDEAQTVGMLMGKRMAFNEFVAYMDLAKLKEQLSPRSFMMATYALCGFANISSMAIQIGGISALAPSRRADLSALAFKAMLGGTLVGCINACIAGILA